MEEGGEFSAIGGMVASTCNEAQQRCVDLVHRNLRILSVVVGEMVQRTVDVSCIISNSTKHVANENQA